MEVGVLRAGVDLGFVLFYLHIRLKVDGSSKHLGDGSVRIQPALASFLRLLCLFGFAPKYTDLLLKGSFTTGFVKLKHRNFLFC